MESYHNPVYTPLMISTSIIVLYLLQLHHHFPKPPLPKGPRTQGLGCRDMMVSGANISLKALNWVSEVLKSGSCILLEPYNEA